MALQISGASFALLYRRTNSKSIDSTEVWTTLADALTYAANTDDVKYVPIDGLIISVTENNKTYRLVPDESISTEDGKKHYKLQEIATTDLLDNYLSKDLFSSVFGLIDTDGNELDLHDDGVIDLTRSIQAKFGLWTNEFLSAKGLNPAEGEMSITLKSLNDVKVSDALVGESLVWNGSYWVNQLIEGGGIDEEALEEYLNLKDYATNSDVTSALSSYATITLVNTKVDSSTFNSTVERIDKDLEDVFADLNTKATKEELSVVSSDLDEFKTETNTNINNLQSDISELDNKKLNVDYFQALFGLIDSNDTEVTPNTEIPETIKGIKAKFGLWTEEYLSALGMNPANGEVSLTLASLNDVLFSELTEGLSIVWNGTKWINQLIESGGLDESLLEDYLSRNSYATTLDITDAISSKVDTTTFNSTISDLNTSISDLETELETKVSKDELNTAVSTINTRIDGVVTDVNTELATKATKTELTEAVTTLEQSISDVDDDLQTFKTTTEENLATKLDIAFFSKVFGLIGEDGSEITVNNDTSVTIESILAKFGLWTELFLSAKGLNPSDGSITGISLKDLAEVNISSPQNGEGLVYQDGYWVNQVVQTGEDGNPFYVWQGESEDAPTLSNAPANQWTTTALKNEHVDDYYVTTEGLVYLFTSEHTWELVTDKYLIDCWNKLNLFDDNLTERVEALEQGSATNIEVTGSGNVVTSLSKTGTKISATKDITVYNRSEIDTKLNGYLPKTGGTMTGDLAISKNSSKSSSYALQFFYGSGNKFLYALDGNLYFDGGRNTGKLYSGDNDGSSSGLDADLLDGKHLNDILNGNVASADKLSDNTAYTAWGLTFFTNGKPKSVSGALTNVTDITASGTITADMIIGTSGVSTLSDRKFKTDIKPLEDRGSVQPVTFVKDGKKSIGFIAQDVQEKYPELVYDNGDYLSLNYQQYTAVLLQLIIDLLREVNELKQLIKLLL